MVINKPPTYICRPLAFRYFQPPRIDIVDRILPDIRVEVKVTTCETYRISRDVASGSWIIKSVPVVMQPSLTIKVLARLYFDTPSQPKELFFFGKEVVLKSIFIGKHYVKCLMRHYTLPRIHLKLMRAAALSVRYAIKEKWKTRVPAQEYPFIKPALPLEKISKLSPEPW